MLSLSLGGECVRMCWILYIASCGIVSNALEGKKGSMAKAWRDRAAILLQRRLYVSVGTLGREERN